MADLQDKLELLLGLADDMGLVVRREPLGGEGGGLCHLKGQRVLFVDTMADLTTRYERTLEALAGLSEINERFIRPDIREDLERLRAGR
jgi:hypothetical protein